MYVMYTIFSLLPLCISVNGTIRLEGTDWTYSHGKFQVYHNDMWNYVCYDDWIDIATSLVCRTLGFGTQGTQGSVDYVYLDNEFLRYEVQCNGNETEFVQCIDYSQSHSGCTHGIALSCPLQGRENYF